MHMTRPDYVDELKSYLGYVIRGKYKVTSTWQWRGRWYVTHTLTTSYAVDYTILAELNDISAQHVQSEITVTWCNVVPHAGE